MSTKSEGLPKRVGEGLEEYWKGFAERHNRPDVLQAFYEGASIWTDDPHPNAWAAKGVSEKFLRDLKSGRFPVRKLFTTAEVAEACKDYVLDWNDFDGRYYLVDNPDVKLTKTEQDAIDGWQGKPFNVKAEKVGPNGKFVEWMEVRALLRQVVRFKYIGVGSVYDRPTRMESDGNTRSSD